MAEPRFELAGGRVFTLREALVVTAVSAVVPGFAHLRSGRRRAGLALSALYAALGFVGVVLPTFLSEVPARPDRHFLITVGPVAAAGAWVALILVSYRAVRPSRPPLPAQTAAGAVVASLCALVAVLPPALAHYGGGGRPARVPAAARPYVPPPLPAAPVPVTAGAARLNLLLVAGRGRPASPVAADEDLMLASVDARTGDTVLLILPGDLRRVPVPGVPATVPLAAVYRYGAAHPKIAGGRTNSPGSALLKRAIGRVTGMPVGYYRVIGIRDLRRLIAGRRTGRCTDGSHVLAADLGRGHATTARRPSPVLVALSAKVRNARVLGVRLVSRRADHARPDYGRLRARARRAAAGRVGGTPTAPHYDSRIPGDMCR